VDLQKNPLVIEEFEIGAGYWLSWLAIIPSSFGACGWVGLVPLKLQAIKNLRVHL
jgi:hypothetical protein